MRSIRPTRRFLPVLLLFLVAAGAGRCGKNPAAPGDPSNPGNTSNASGGTVKGIVIAADGVTRIGLVTVSLSGGTQSTTTDAQGAYTLTGLPEGPHTLQAKRGNFGASVSVTVKSNDTVTAPDAILTAIKKLAFVPGSNDSVEVLIRQFGNTIDELAATQLSDAGTLNQYGMIFLDCGLDQKPLANPATASTILAWIRAGGFLYASDQAFGYLYQMVPNDFTLLGSGDVQQISATVADSELKTFLNQSSVQVNYDLPGWVALQSVAAGAKIFLNGSYVYNEGTATTQNRPLAMSFVEGSGHILFTTFHNAADATPDQVKVLRFFIYFQ